MLHTSHPRKCMASKLKLKPLKSKCVILFLLSVNACKTQRLHVNIGGMIPSDVPYHVERGP